MQTEYITHLAGVKPVIQGLHSAVDAEQIYESIAWYLVHILEIMVVLCDDLGQAA